MAINTDKVCRKQMVSYATIISLRNQRLRSITLDRYVVLHKMKALTITGLAAFLAASVSAQSSATIYSVATTIPWSPKAPLSVDQSVVYNDTYYLSDRTNAGVSIRFLSCALPAHTFDRYMLSPLSTIRKPNSSQASTPASLRESSAPLSPARTA
jgi:hypothetical protein